MGVKSPAKTLGTQKNQAEAANYARERSVRIQGKQHSIEDAGEILKARLPGYLDGLHALANNAESESVKLEAYKYLTNRILGSPVEVTKVQQMQPVEVPSITVTSLIPEKGEQIVKEIHHVSAEPQH